MTHADPIRKLPLSDVEDASKFISPMNWKGSGQLPEPPLISGKL